MPDIQEGDLVRIGKRKPEKGMQEMFKRKNNLWTVLELHRENKFRGGSATATIHNGHKLLTIPQKLLEKL